MSDIELVIKIPEKSYNTIKSDLYNTFPAEWKKWGLEAIRNGTLLPKGHGELIERKPIYDKLMRSYRADEKDYPERGKDYRVGLSNAIDLLMKAPTIIEADKFPNPNNELENPFNDSRFGG